MHSLLHMGSARSHDHPSEHSLLHGRGGLTQQHMPSEVCHHEGDGNQHQIRGSKAVPVGSCSGLSLPPGVLCQVGEGCQSQACRYGVCKGSCPCRRGDPQESGQQERPASAADCRAGRCQVLG